VRGGTYLVKGQHTQEALDGEHIVPYESLSRRVPALRDEFAGADPYPHVVLENFLPADVIERMLAEFPAVRSGEWIHYVHFNERKFGQTDRELFGPTIRAVVEELNSPRFLGLLRDITGIDDLLPDCRRLGVRLAMENLVHENFDQLDQLMPLYPPDVLGICYDPGHGRIAGTGLDRLSAQTNRLIALHLNDNDARRDLHQPPSWARSIGRAWPLCSPNPTTAGQP